MNNIISNLINKTNNINFTNNINISNLNISERSIQNTNISISDNDIKKYNNNNINIRTFIKNKCTFNNDFIKLNDIFYNKFMSYEICNFIVKNIKYKFVIKNKNYNITFYFYNKDKNILLINEIINVVNYCKTILDINKQINLVLYLTPLKKKFTKELNVNNINSGSTNLQEIYIFREEEILKVIIHELIHYSKYDLQNSKYLNDLMLKK